jgi:hypothetical protein
MSRPETPVGYKRWICMTAAISKHAIFIYLPHPSGRHPVPAHKNIELLAVSSATITQYVGHHWAIAFARLLSSAVRGAVGIQCTVCSCCNTPVAHLASCAAAAHLAPAHEDADLLPCVGLATNNEDYYPTIAINALMRVLRDRSCASLHAKAVSAVMEIFMSLNSQAVPFLDKV